MPAMRNTQTKGWCFTSYETEEPPYLDSMTYLIAGRETCPDTDNKLLEMFFFLFYKKKMQCKKKKLALLFVT